MRTRQTVRVLLSVLVAAVAAPGVLAGGGPENVAVVVNSESWASLAVANEYVRLRHIPPNNVIYLRNVPGFEMIDVEQFRQKILLPVLKVLELRKLAPQIDYVVYSSDVPYGVNVDKDVGDTKLPRVITRVASINGLTYLYPLVINKNANYLGLAANLYMRNLIHREEDTPWAADEQKRYGQAIELLKDGKHDEALAILSDVEKKHPKSATLLYNLACCLSLMGKADDAMAYLARSVDAGWLDLYHTMRDDDLKALAQRDDYKALIQKMNGMVHDVQPTRGFRGMYGWSAQGQIVPPDKGLRYMLSTMLAVTSGRGTSLDETLAYLRRSVKADGTRPDGTIYFLENGDVRARTRQWAFKSAAAHLQKLGVRAQVIEGSIPKDKPDVMGAVVGVAGFNFASSGSTILPGAICEHLTSLGGVMRQHGGQTPLTEFLRAGAAGASGTVTEPFAIQAKFPTAFIQVHYARGCSLAEAFYQSVSGPYQLLIVGDALCAPWARPPKVTVKGVEPDQTVTGTIKIEPRVEPGDDHAPVRHVELIVDGLRVRAVKPGETIDVDTTLFPDGYHELRIIAVSGDDLETQGRAIVPVMVNNHGRSIELTASKAGVATLGESITIDAKLKDARGLLLSNNGRIIGGIKGEAGKFTVDTNVLGLGVTMVQAVGVVGQGEQQQRVMSRPLTITVARPAALAALNTTKWADLAEGVQLTPASAKDTAAAAAKPPSIVTDLKSPAWPKNNGVEKGQPFTVDAFFNASSDDLYQFQINAGAALALEVDGRSLGKVEPGKWVYTPVPLAAGVHRLHIAAEKDGDPRLDIRFGAKGTQSITGQAFRHVMTEGEGE